ncbi:hypothetical protein BD779DRAFT_1535411 [Infundibulicybe gibba]|nr:hypothetical protein BD779DRAFT_1535411 [Infundibulicybe gibba]
MDYAVTSLSPPRNPPNMHPRKRNSTLRLHAKAESLRPPQYVSHPHMQLTFPIHACPSPVPVGGLYTSVHAHVHIHAFVETKCIYVETI